MMARFSSETTTKRRVSRCNQSPASRRAGQPSAHDHQINEWVTCCFSQRFGMARSGFRSVLRIRYLAGLRRAYTVLMPRPNPIHAVAILGPKSRPSKLN